MYRYRIDVDSNTYRYSGISRKQCFGSVFIFSGTGSGSRGWGWRPIRIRIQGFNDQKSKKNNSWKKIKMFFWSKTAIYLFLGLHKVPYVQVTEEACSSQKRPSNTSKHEFFLLLSLCGSFLPSWIRIHWPDWIRIQSGSGSGSGTLVERLDW